LFFFSSRRRHTRFSRDWSSDVCSSDLGGTVMDILKGIRSLGMRKKELGIPAPAWVFSNNGLWVYASDEYATYVNNAYKKIPWVRSEERRVGKGRMAGVWRSRSRKARPG